MQPSALGFNSQPSTCSLAIPAATHTLRSNPTHPTWLFSHPAPGATLKLSIFLGVEKPSFLPSRPPLLLLSSLPSLPSFSFFLSPYKTPLRTWKKCQEKCGDWKMEKDFPQKEAKVTPCGLTLAQRETPWDTDYPVSSELSLLIQFLLNSAPLLQRRKKGGRPFFHLRLRLAEPQARSWESLLSPDQDFSRDYQLLGSQSWPQFICHLVARTNIAFSLPQVSFPDTGSILNCTPAHVVSLMKALRQHLLASLSYHQEKAKILRESGHPRDLLRT